MKNSSFSSALLFWYHKHKRDLPWRKTKEPYKIWLSEIILQQTRVGQGLPYYQAFCQKYPSVTDLANASEQEVLRLWQGLGYYSRARNLHQCARLIVEKYQGKFPDCYHELLALPGIGDYTAAAIASFAFNLPTPVVDGNVFRVLSRIFGIKDDIGLQKTKKVFRDYSSKLISSSAPDLYNQAIMEFGALHCTPAQPKCISCPFSNYCYAFQNQAQHQFPVKVKKRAVRNRYFYYYVVKSGPYLLMKKREQKDIWQGLYDFFLLEQKEATDPIQLLESILPDGLWLEQVQINEPSATYQHRLTHQLINAQFLVVEPQNHQVLSNWKQGFGLKSFTVQEVLDLPKPILIDNYLKEDIF